MVREISTRDLAKQMANGHAVLLLDVRQLWENQLAVIPGSMHIPLNELCHRTREIPAALENQIVVYCHHGVRSLSAAGLLQRVGITNVRSLAGGIDAWSCEIDPTIPRY